MIVICFIRIITIIRIIRIRIITITIITITIIRIRIRITIITYKTIKDSSPLVTYPFYKMIYRSVFNYQ